MKIQHILFGAAVAGVVAVALIPHHVGPSSLYPSRISPGLIATSDINQLTTTSSCGTYSQCHRQTSGQMKDKVRSEYPTCPTASGQSEIDHIVPLALGGADDVRNLWCEPANLQWKGQNYGFHTKDKLENYLVIQVKAKNLTPQVAQQCIIKDWVACYLKYFGKTPNYGGIAPEDPDDIGEVQ